MSVNNDRRAIFKCPATQSGECAAMQATTRLPSSPPSLETRVMALEQWAAAMSAPDLKWYPPIDASVE